MCVFSNLVGGRGLFQKMHEDDAWECMRVQVIENQWGVPDSDRDDKRQVGRGGAKEEGHPFSTTDNIKYLRCILQITKSDFRQGKTKGKVHPFSTMYIILDIVYKLHLFYFRQGKSNRKGSPFSPPYNILLISEGRAESKEHGRDM